MVISKTVNWMRVSWLAAWMVMVSLVAMAQGGPVVEEGRFRVHELEHAIGWESYRVVEGPGGHGLTMTVTTESADRGMNRKSSAELRMSDGFAPMYFEQKAGGARAAAGDGSSTVEIKGGMATVHEVGQSRTIHKPLVAFVGFNSMPASVQMMMMRYWKRMHQPLKLSMLRVNEKALPLEIREVGHDVYDVKGARVRLTRYTVANLVWGREILWMNEHGRLAAVMTFAGGLPMESVLDEYESVQSQLFHSAVQQEMLDLDDIARVVKPTVTGAYAIVGATLIDSTGAAAVPNAVVIVNGGRITAAGPAASVKVPVGMRVVHADGKSVLPGLWEMHQHTSGVEFGPALLAAGVTTVRDAGGEFEFLTTWRRKIESGGLGPRLLLAGLIDSGGPLAFGAIDVNSPGEGMWAVDQYADAKFEQIKAYTQIKPDVLKAISDEAHKRGMTVTGHVPAAMNAFEGIADGMDQINHLQFVIRAMNPDNSVQTVDLTTERSQKFLALLKEKDIVVDPTDGWGEMAGRPKSEDPTSFEPGLKFAPYTLASKYMGMGVPESGAEAFKQRMETNKKVTAELIKRGITIVPGTDTGLVGYGLDRELELYVEAGMTPMQAIQSATIVSARVMKLDKDLGSVEVGKRADLVIVDGNPLERISDLRKVVSVVTAGRMYDSRALWRSVGFTR